MMENIILCGFMGCGKTTVGKILAKTLSMSFVDMDSYIEEKANMTVSQIFDTYGEDYFRDLEHQACVSLSKTKGKVIATGGGALTFERNTKALKECGKIFFLKTSFNCLYSRLSKDTTRPLLQKKDKEKEIQKLLEYRTPLYEKACDIVINGDLSPKKVAEEIANNLK